MGYLEVTAPAKTNLTFSITGRRDDGYHLLESLFHSISICDKLTLETVGEGFELISDCNIPADDNIITRADKALRERFSDMPGIRARLDKVIPQQAGMGGGSADCAAYLKGVNELCSLGLTTKELVDIGEKLGADVPFCIIGGTAVVRGIGEIIDPVDTDMEINFVVLKPEVSCSTPLMYRKIDELGENMVQRFETEAAARAKREHDLPKLLSLIHNTFEDTIDHKEIFEAKQMLLDAGAAGVMLSGSGSAVFGIFESEELAKKAADELGKSIWAMACKSYR